MEITKALFLAMEKYPYYARAFGALTLVEKKVDIGAGATLGVDKWWRLYYCKEALEKFKYHIEAVMCHEIEHLLREHAERREERNQQKWNIAADAEINDDINNLPDECIFPSTLDMEEGLTAEDYYKTDKVEVIEMPVMISSASTGDKEEWELDAPGKSKVEGIDEFEKDVLLDSIAEDIKQHQKKRGDVPNGVLIWAELRAEGKLPRVSWKQYVSNRVKQIIHGRNDFTYSKISRRQDPSSKFLRPGTIKYKPDISIVLDTSGSMNDIGDWVAGCVKDVSKMNANVKIIDCDAEVHAVRRLKSWKDLLKSLGGGGTDMTVGIEAAQKMKSDIILVITDGYTPWPKVIPKNMIGVINDGKEISVIDSKNKPNNDW